MRFGLVAIGLAFVLVGAGLLASFFLFNSTAPPGALTRTVTASEILPNQTQEWALDTVGTGQGTVTLSWGSNVPADVGFYQGSTCGSSWCPQPPALVAWTANTSGAWHTSGSVPGAYVLTVTDHGGRSVEFNATLSETYPGNAFGFGSIDVVLVTVAAVLLLGTGAVGLFLGLFLPGGVYQTPRTPSRRFDYGDPDETPYESLEDDGPSSEPDDDR